MDPDKGAEAGLKFELFPKNIKVAVPKRRIVPFSPYQVTLFLSDVFFSGLAFFACIYITTGNLLHLRAEPAHWAMLALFAGILIAFFPTYRLYSYHLIFSKKNHLKNLIKAFCWSILMFCVVDFIYDWPIVIKSHSLISGGLLVLSASGLLIFGRFFGDHIVNFFKTLGLSFIVVGLAGLLLKNDQLALFAEPKILLIAVPLSMLSMGMVRYFLVYVVYNVWMRRRFRRQVAVIGTDKEAERIVNHIIRFDTPFWIAGLIDGRKGCGLAVQSAKACLGKLPHFPRIARANHLDEVIVTDEAIDKRTLISLLDYCTSTGITVWFAPKLLPIIDMKLYIDNFCGLPMIRMCAQRNDWLFAKIKHALDALVTLPLFILQLPVFLLIAIAVKRGSKGPVFYRAKAVGKNGQKFEMLKFRSMRIDADSDIHRQYVSRLIKGEIGQDQKEKTPLKITDDPRITRVGRWLRKLSLDELPQLINVLKGDMSLVGPRPCLPYEYAIYKDWHKKRSSVRPGITGLWQVTGRSEVSFEEMILLDLYYIYNRSLVMDLTILYETIFVVFGKKGAY